MPLIAVDDLHVYLGESHVLQGVSFEVPEGGVTALLGRNGVGKTTTLRAMMGLVPRRGSVLLAGGELNRLPTHSIVRRGIGYVPEDRDVFAGLTVDENLRLAERDGSPRYELVYELFPELKRAADRRPARSRAGSSRWSRSPARSSTTTRCCWWTSRRRGWRRCSSPRSRRRSNGQRRPRPCCWSSRTSPSSHASRRRWSCSTAAASSTRAARRSCSTTPSASARSFGVHGGGALSTFVLLTITGLGLGAMYFLIASGLSLIYGLMGVLNFAHGAFLTVGAYAAWETSTHVGGGPGDTAPGRGHCRARGRGGTGGARRAAC